MKKNNELDFILDALRHDFNSQAALNLTVVDQFTSHPTHWPSIYQLIMRHRVWHQIYPFIVKNTNHKDIRLNQFCQQDKLKILSKIEETLQISKCFNQNEIQYCFIKGIVLNLLLYNKYDMRPCSDIDVWVHPKQYEQAIKHLTSLGYQPKLPGSLVTGFQKRYYLRHFHDFSFYHPHKKILIELHYKLSYTGVSFFFPQAEMLCQINYFGTPLTTLKTDYHLLFLMIHGAIHAWIRMRWLYDIALFINKKSYDLHQVMQLARKINCEHIVLQSLLLVQHFFKLKHENIIQLTTNPSNQVQKITRLAQQFLVADYEHHQGLANIRMFIKYRYYLACLSIKGQKLNAIFRDLFKIENLFSQVNFSSRLSFLYYFIYPVWVIRYAWGKQKNNN